jgi:type I restriction enzyme S subunit
MSSKGVGTMSDENSEKSMLVPRLRFPEFRDAGEWNHAPLGRLFSERQEAGFTNLPLLSLMDKEGIVPQEETNRKNNSSADKSKYLRVVPGDIAYNTMRMWEGRSAYVGIEGLISPAYTVCIPAEGINSIFFSYHFKTEVLIRQFRRYSQGLVKDTLNLKYEAFSRIETSYPEDEQEQQKIADCLSSLDELIAAETEKLDALKTHKKGLMQQLFPREGETVPRLRFPEFREAGEWEEKRLGEVGNVRMCKRILKEQTSPQGDIPFYKIGTFGGIPDAYISREVFESFRSSYPFPKKGAVLISAAGTIGRTVCYDGELAYFQDSNIVWLENDGDLIADGFLLHSYQLINWAPSVGAIQRLYNENILAAKVKFSSIPEQQRIADCLSSLDDLITAQSQKIDALKTHKTGLMQQLFPVLEKVSA